MKWSIISIIASDKNVISKLINIVKYRDLRSKKQANYICKKFVIGTSD